MREGKGSHIGAAAGIAAACVVSAVLPTNAAAAATTVQCADLPAAIAAASAGDELKVRGKCTLTTNTVVDKQLTITGAGATISTSGTAQLFTITAPGTVLQRITFVKTDKAGPQNLVGVQANNVSIVRNTFTGQYVLGDPDVSRALEVSTVQGVTIKGNTVTGLRQPAYINDNTTGLVQGNRVSGTRGFVAVANSDLVFTGNRWDGNAVDVAIIPGAPNNYDCADVRRIVFDNYLATVDLQVPPAPCPTFPRKAAECGKGGFATFTVQVFATVRDCTRWLAEERRG